MLAALTQYRQSRGKHEYQLASQIQSIIINQFVSTRADEHVALEVDGLTPVPPFSCKFCPARNSSHVLAIADEGGSVQLVNYNRSAVVKEWNAHANAIFDIAWRSDGDKLLTGSGDGTVIEWDTCKNINLAAYAGHKGSVKCIDIQPDDTGVFATGSRDGSIMIWDPRCNKAGGLYKPVNMIQNAHGINPHKKIFRKDASTFTANSVTCIVYHGSHTILSAGATDGKLKEWDIRRCYSSPKSISKPLSEIFYSGNSPRARGFTSLVIDSTRSNLFASCTDNRIYKYNLHSTTIKPSAVYSGHSNASFFVKAALSPDDRYLISGSSCTNSYIWKVSNPTQAPLTLIGHSSEVTCVDWCPHDFGFIATCSDDNYRIWRLRNDYDVIEPRNLIGVCQTAAETTTSEKSSVQNNDRINILDPIENRNSSPTISEKKVVQQQLNLSPVCITHQGNKRPSGVLTKGIGNCLNSKDTNLNTTPRKKLKYEMKKHHKAKNIASQTHLDNSTSKQMSIESYFK
ncbi:Denticleless protein-like protein [Trichoplax sp. H2]|uniref:Uncharacterized protein n=1 Tax=Trichoplax adhaerens TaxID=10228 RepID=B3SCN0_TRIAD|nr:hypothetical protein TRIADDRAFT_62034 [Trichoplax adhaerens]EDV19502.1 hypothetical protein TRIADDRAFT_62034 [Trichoplax adhaerens]RDD37754.1 Denticleless protein-like protein [Trichoplax sp. H2]|eukprot:XP_002118019.1 hypothetical protein TRIADDRAFT_62034 [Trichoplax adhaerens]